YPYRHPAPSYISSRSLPDALPISIRTNNIPAVDKDASRSGEIATKNVDLKDLHTVIKDVLKKSSDGVDLSEASVVVAGGRGVERAEGLKPLYELAEEEGAADGASRGAS